MLLRYKDNVIVIIFLAVLVLVTYWPVQHYHEFNNFDDFVYITNNPSLQQGITLKNIKTAFADISVGHWHPITWLSHMLDCQIFRLNAGGHHWTSVIIHLINAALLFLFLNFATGAVGRSAFVAALFAVHPINVESVAWIAERKNVLSTFFWLATMLLYLWYVKKPVMARYLCVLASFILGLMTKSMLVTLPFVLLLLDYWPLKRVIISPCNEGDKSFSWVSERKTISYLFAEKIPFFVISAVFSFVAFYAAHAVGTLSGPERVSFYNIFSNVVNSYVLYIKKLFLPFDLAVLYPYNFNIPLGQAVFALFLIMALTFLTLKFWRRFPYLLFGWLFYLGTLVPVIGIVPAGPQAMADRYAYVTFIGLFIMLAWGGNDLLKKYVSRTFIAAAGLAVIVLLIIPAHCQVKTWENSYTLWKRALAVAKENYIPHKNLSVYLLNNNRDDEGIYHVRRAIELKGNDAGLYNNLGMALFKVGKRDEAFSAWHKALELDPGNIRAVANLAKAYLTVGKMDEAEKYLRRAIVLGNQKITKAQDKYDSLHIVYYLLADILKKKGKHQEAKHYLQESKRIFNERF